MEKKPMNNAKQILAMNTIRTSVYWTDEETLQQIWGEILRWAFELLYVNAIAKGKQEDAYWSQTMTKLIPRDQT